MNNTQKVILAIGVGVGVAFLYDRYKKGKLPFKPKNNSPKDTKTEKSASSSTSSNSAISDLSREEKEEFILDKVSAKSEEIKSGFEGTRFVWNPTIGKMYPVGTIEEGIEPEYIESVFLSAEGDVVANIPNAVENAESVLKDLDDREIDLAYQVVKTMDKNPSIKSEEEAVKQLGVSNPNIIQVVQKRIKKRLNDVKILKKDGNWKSRWNKRKEMRKKRRNDFRAKTGVDKSVFDRAVRKKCGKRSLVNRAIHKKCVENVADKMRNQIKTEIRSEVSNAPVSQKEQITATRQKSFTTQITNRNTGGMFAGKRWDGESNAYVENLVDKGLV